MSENRTLEQFYKGMLKDIKVTLENVKNKDKHAEIAIVLCIQQSFRWAMDSSLKHEDYLDVFTDNAGDLYKFARDRENEVWRQA